MSAIGTELQPDYILRVGRRFERAKITYEIAPDLGHWAS
jgi:hypothetical protein